MHRRSILGGLMVAPLVACQPMPVGQNLSSQDNTEIDHVEAYLNGIKSLQARFFQIWPNDTSSTGTLWMDRPGRLRLQYAPPSPLTLVAAQGTLLIYDSANQGTTTLPLARTPLSILLDQTISLRGPVTVTRVDSAPAQLAMTMVRTAAPQQGSLTLLFSRTPLTLRSIRMVDAEGHITDLTLLDLLPNRPIDPALFQL
jgi:outer membrane lipoprotein-sorting protein